MRQGAERGWRLQRAGLAGGAAGARQVSGARGRGWNVRRAPVTPRHHRQGRPTPDGPGPRPPLRPLPGARRSSCPPRPSSNLGTARPPWPRPKLPERGGPGTPPGPDSGSADRTYLPRRRAGEGGELSAAPAGVRWARRARAFKTPPRDSARWCQAGRALPAPCSPARPGQSPAARSHSAPRRARSSGEQDGCDLGPKDAQEEGTHPTHSSFGGWRNLSLAGC